jgi:hypothetical protein
MTNEKAVQGKGRGRIRDMDVSAPYTSGLRVTRPGYHGCIGKRRIDRGQTAGACIGMAG